MKIEANTPRAERTIEGIKVQVPAPYAEGQTLTPALAAILNQTLAENISNNLRAKLKLGHVPAGSPEGTEAQPHNETSAQALVDTYVESYEPGVKRGGGGEARVTDPAEREARKIAKAKATELVKSKGMKPADVDMADITNRIFEANKDRLMAEGKKIVKALEAAKNKSDDLVLGDLFGAAEPTGGAE